jgi:threonine dehydrogenase-like Zn-dependent dehydrogenase
MPRFGHVIVVGMGQVGLRLAQELQELGIAVVGIEQNPNARTLQIARSCGIPVLIGDGASKAAVRATGVKGAVALVAASSEERDNIAVAVGALAANPQLRVVIRAGDRIKRTIEQRDYLAQRDPCRMRDELVATAHAALATQQTAVLESEQDLLKELQRDMLFAGEILDGEVRALALTSHRHKGAEGVFGFFGELHGRERNAIGTSNHRWRKLRFAAGVIQRHSSP